MEIIPYGVEQAYLNQYIQFSVKKIRTTFKEKTDLFGAVGGIEDSRKGFDLLQAAIKQLVKKEMTLNL